MKLKPSGGNYFNRKLMNVIVIEILIELSQVFLWESPIQVSFVRPSPHRTNQVQVQLYLPKRSALAETEVVLHGRARQGNPTSAMSLPLKQIPDCVHLVAKRPRLSQKYNSDFIGRRRHHYHF